VTVGVVLTSLILTFNSSVQDLVFTTFGMPLRWFYQNTGFPGYRTRSKFNNRNLEKLRESKVGERGLDESEKSRMRKAVDRGKKPDPVFPMWQTRKRDVKTMV
jgi:hypothetical protein